MTSCRITKIKDFMGKLLTTDCFDSFLLEQATITTYNTFTIDGRLEKAFYTSEEWEDTSVRPYAFSCWTDIRPVCFSLIKGKKTPVHMKFILQLKPEKMQALLTQNELHVPDGFLNAFVITIRYGENGMTCTTGVSYSDFWADKSPERLWDKAFLQFLDKAGIAVEEI